MGKTKPLGKGLAALTGGQAILSTQEAASGDETGAAIYVERERYERAVLDFESEVRRRRDALRAEHHANLRAIFQEDMPA